MLLTPIVHPELLAALGRAGHGSKILLSDGNYPHGTGAFAGAARVYLNVSPGLLTVDQILRPLVATTPFEAAEVMGADDGTEAAAIGGYRSALPGTPFVVHGREDFYAAARDPRVALVIATADQRSRANLLLTIGVRQP